MVTNTCNRAMEFPGIFIETIRSYDVVGISPQIVRWAFMLIYISIPELHHSRWLLCQYGGCFTSTNSIPTKQIGFNRMDTCHHRALGFAIQMLRNMQCKLIWKIAVPPAVGFAVCAWTFELLSIWSIQHISNWNILKMIFWCTCL